MKKVNLSTLTDINVLSWTLDRALFLLANSPANLRLSELSRATGLPAPALTRMRLLHVNPQYEPLVNQYMLVNLLRFVFQQFPTLALRQAQDGKILVYLYKSQSGQKLAALPEASPSMQLFKRNPPKPGSTRWFLTQYDGESPQSQIG